MKSLKEKVPTPSPLSDFYTVKYVFPTIQESIDFNDLPNHYRVSLASNLRTKVSCTVHGMLLPWFR